MHLSNNPGPDHASRLLIVLSDFELFDNDIPGTLDKLVTAPAEAVLALVFSAPPPPTLAENGATVHHIDPRSSDPADVAHHIIDVAKIVACSARAVGLTRAHPMS